MAARQRGAFFRGMRAATPVLLGFFPVALSYAVIARQAGLSSAETALMSLTVFAGASQMMAAGMLRQGASLAAIVLATFILNLRHLIMSACVYERMAPSRLAPRLLSAYWVTDESFALFTTWERSEDCTVSFYLGMGLATYLAWFAGSLLGALVTDLLPLRLSAALGVALYAMFAALLSPHLRGNGRLALLVLLTALANTLLCRFMAASWALVSATLLGAAAGTFFVELDEEADHDR